MSVSYSADDATRWAGGELLRGARELEFAATSHDTRTLSPGALFVAIRGPNHDAHGFLAQALDAGAAGLVVERGRFELAALPGEAPVIAVEDSTRALGAIASGHRARFEGPLVGITGSSGKTTTKEMCAAILAGVAPCLATRGNLNNEYGVPLTLLRREPEHRFAVIEMGMNHRGEIARLAEIARPDVGLVTNVGSAHIEFLGSREEIAREKGDLYAALGPEGVAVANLDDPLAAAQAERGAGRTLGFGRKSGDAAVRAGDLRFTGSAFAFELTTPAGGAAIEVIGLGETTVINALAAAAAAHAAGADPDQIAKGLAQYRPPAGRMTPVVLPIRATLIDDTYNANPQSMAASLRALRELAGEGRALAILGDMGELGDAADEAHREVGALAAELELDGLYALGARAALVCEGARAAGLDAARARIARDHDQLAAAAGDELRAGDWVLVKGSRAMHMERVVEALAGEEAH